MVITPNSDIILLKSDLKLDNYNQITFSDATAQYNHFHGLTKLECSDATYVRKDGVIRFPTHTELNDRLPTYEDLLKYNYCMYKNTNFSNKWFYAFITDITYINDGMTEIKIETDVFQTWQFDIVYKNSFIEREHVSDDTIGSHTIPEGLETGDYVCNAIGNLASNLKDCYVGAMTTVIPDDLSANTFNTRYGGVFAGGVMLVFQDWLSACNFTRAYDLVNKPEAITSMFMIPRSLTGTISSWTTCGMTEGGHTINFSCAVVPYTDSETLIGSAVSVTSPSTLNGYTPRNNKLFVWPYNYFYVSNTVGTDIDFKYEDFVSNAPSFKTIGTITPGCSIRTVPINYKKLSDSGSSYNHFNCGITAPKYPICSWTNDSYTNWLTEQSVNTGLTIAGGVGAIIGGGALIATGGGALSGVGLIGSGIGAIASKAAEYYKHEMIPPQSRGNINSGDVAFASGSFEQPYYKMSVRYEMAKVIDDFFTMFGYKVNRLATPNIHKRSNWDYIKCVDVNLDGEIPEVDLEKIRKLFNNGCTFWHTTSKFLDYSQTNSILT